MSIECAVHTRSRAVQHSACNCCGCFCCCCYFCSAIHLSQKVPYYTLFYIILKPVSTFIYICAIKRRTQLSQWYETGRYFKTELEIGTITIFPGFFKHVTYF
uniref:Uncharacterized protein n=1 Tax=Cacopsylla melanoneura TaxID=428564 RepID=A0A8D9BGC9_9HEMI